MEWALFRDQVLPALPRLTRLSAAMHFRTDIARLPVTLWWERILPMPWADWKQESDMQA
jgi:hypothetical protein